MLVTFDLTSRQAARVLAQALRNAATLTLEPRIWPDGPVLRAKLTARNGNLLTVELEDARDEPALATLVGVFCDVQTVLSGHLYLFSTCVVDVAENLVPPRLLLATPYELQLVNRRRLERRLLAQPSPVQMSTEANTQPPMGELLDISGDGLACRVPRADLEDVLLVGDAIRVSFELPGHGGFFDLPALICNKAASDGDEYMTVGLQFDRSDDPAARDALYRLRGIVCGEVAGTTESEGHQ